ncbi:hypothetical protein GC167_08960 [bacterium]|nr:hypothetical protein [bacterium]
MQNKKESERWAAYTAAAAGLLGVEANAQVQYVDFEPDLNLVGHREQLRIDVNGDGIEDFVLVTEDTALAAGSLYYDIGRLIGGGYANTANDMIGSFPGAYDYVSRLDPGAWISPDRNFVNGGTFAFSVDGQHPYNEPWNGGVVDGYVGLRFVVDDSLHYGWMRLDVSANGKQVVVKDAAFNTIADSGLYAGSIWLSTEEHALPALRYAGGTLKIPSHEGPAVQLTLFSGMGQQLGQWLLNGAEFELDLGDRPQGLYVFRLSERDRPKNSRQLVVIR